MTKNKAKVGGKTIEQWEGEWVRVTGGFNAPATDLRQSVGLYRAVLRGLAKRIADFTRPSPSGREHHGGEYIHDHLDDLELEVLVTGSDKQAAQTAKALKEHVLALHSPPNVRGKRRPKLTPIRRSGPTVRHRGLPSEHQRAAV